MQKDNSEINQDNHHRRTIRLKGYDYSQPGAYFVTICTHENHSLFGKIVDGEMQLNELGKAVEFTWNDLVNHVDGIELGPFVIMPNHIHAIIQIIEVGAGLEPARTEPARTEPVRTEPARTEPARTEPTYTDPTHTEPIHTEPTRTEPTRTERARTEPARTEPTLTPMKAQTPLPEIVRQLKTFSAKRINILRKTTGKPVWQRNYYEHIIRNDQSFQKIGEYILSNPIQWENDRYYPEGTL